MPTLAAARSRSRWGVAGAAALVSIVTMPLTAIWFLLVGGLLLLGSLAVAAARDVPTLAAPGFVGLGLLAGPAIYLGLALVQ